MRKAIFKKTIVFALIAMTIFSTVALSVYNAEASDGISAWDGKKCTEPELENGWLLIDEASDIAWILKNQKTKDATKIKLEVSVNLKDKKLKSFPATITEFDGNGHSIIDWTINGKGAFNATANLNVYDLTLDSVSITSSSYDLGGFVGTLKGSAIFTNCHIKNSAISTTKGYAGGMVGYIVRSSKTNRDLSLDVTFNNCSVNNTTIAGSKAEGKFVGALSGYDNGEVLNFNNCTSNSNVADFKSMYIADNQSVFLNKLDKKYNGFIGTEVYYRGIINFDGNRFMPKWDGTTAITPLASNPTYDKGTVKGSGKYAVYSAFDLAGLRAKTAKPTALYLMCDVDMNGQGKDGIYNVPSLFTKSKKASKDDNNFTPFERIATLDGMNHTVYNLAISELEKEAGAFILTASGTTIHKNITFNNCQTVATHKAVSTNATAKGAILIANAAGSNYTMDNVKAINCRTFALQKVGTLAGMVSATKSTLKNNAVENCYVENYKCNISERFDSGTKKWKGYSLRVYADFYPHGEVGGMYGFVQGTATISNCHVKNTKIYGFGQNDKMATVTGSTLARAAIKLAGYYLVPGRHIGTFIGDIRVNKTTVTITNCTVDSATKCTNRADKHNSTYNFIGQAYYVEFMDKIGTVTVNGKKLTLADCNKYTVR